MWRMSLTVMFRATGSTRAPGADAHRRLTLPCRGSTGLRGHHPTGAFRTSFAKLKIKAGSPPGFDLNEFFTLARNSNGINPVTENVTLKIGAFSVTIPPDSFKQILPEDLSFRGPSNGVSLQVQIAHLGNNILTFKAEGTGVDLTPVTELLTIGIDSGTTTGTAQFQ